MAVNLTAAISVKECVDVSRPTLAPTNISFGSLRSRTLCRTLRRR
jgi:hypothetical protein